MNPLNPTPGFEVELFNAHDVTRQCIGEAVSLVRSKFADDTIEEIQFWDGFVEVERYALPREVIPFNVTRTQGAKT